MLNFSSSTFQKTENFDPAKKKKVGIKFDAEDGVRAGFPPSTAGWGGFWGSESGQLVDGGEEGGEAGGDLIGEIEPPPARQNTSTHLPSP